MASLRDKIDELLAQYEPRVRKAFEDALADLRANVDLREVARALERGDLEAALDAFHLEPAPFRMLQDVIGQAYSASGLVAMEAFPVLRGPSGARIVQRFDVRNPRAEQQLATMSSNAVTNIVEGQRQVIRAALAASLEVGRGPIDTARDITGRVNATTGVREGGIIGLTEPQRATSEWVQRALATSDRAGLARYLGLRESDIGLPRRQLLAALKDRGLKLRDRRFDSAVLDVLQGKRKALPPEDAGKIVARMNAKQLALRGQMVARTETLGALNAAQMEAFRQGLERTNYGPQDVIRMWSSAGDGRVRHTHRSLNRTKVRGMDQPFTSPSGAQLMYPGDPAGGAAEVINCRCIVQYRIDLYGDG